MTIRMTDGFSIYAFSCYPEGKPVGHIHILHGMAEHSGRYTPAIRYFVERGYIVSGHDHRGHGKTAQLNGMLGYFSDNDGFNRVVDDAFEVVSHLQKNDSSLKFILLGHSMGSFIARRYIQLYGDHVDLAVLSGTGDNSGIARHGALAIAHAFGKKNGFKERNKLLNSLVLGGFNKAIEDPKTEFDWISKDPKHIEAYMNDEYCGFIPTTGFFVDLFDGLGLIHKKKEIGKIPEILPILLFSGIEDPVGNNGKAVWKVARQYDKAGIEDVTVLLFEDARHEILNDLTREDVIGAVFEWVENR